MAVGRVITVTGQKGGCGKTNTATHLSAEFVRRGYRTLLVDLDPQGTALAWASPDDEVEESETPSLMPTVIGMGDNVRTQLPGMLGAYDLVVIDTPGRLAKRVAGALMISDLALLPVIPSPSDVWALGGSLETVENVQAVRELQALVLVNGVTRSGLTNDVLEELANLNLSVCDTKIGQRVAYREALSAGEGVTTYAPDSKAAMEIRTLAKEILGDEHGT